MVIEKQSLTVNEAAEYAGIGRNTLRMLINWDAFPVIRIGNKIVIRVETLERFLRENEGNDLRNRHEIVAI